MLFTEKEATNSLLYRYFALVHNVCVKKAKENGTYAQPVGDMAGKVALVGEKELYKVCMLRDLLRQTSEPH